MTITPEQYNGLFNAAYADQLAQGFVGMDFRMAVLCIIALRTGRAMTFRQGVGKTHEEKLHYWASKRHFCELPFSSEDEILEHALQSYHICPRCGAQMRKMYLLRYNSPYSCPECNHQCHP